jgi:Leucine-rich repeat (LRR) protein
MRIKPAARSSQNTILRIAVATQVVSIKLCSTPCDKEPLKHLRADSLTGFVHLTALNLSGNALRSVVGVVGLQRLQHLSLARNRLRSVYMHSK